MRQHPPVNGKDAEVTDAQWIQGEQDEVEGKALGVAMATAAATPGLRVRGRERDVGG